MNRLITCAYGFAIRAAEPRALAEKKKLLHLLASAASKSARKDIFQDTLGSHV
nr:hypothetical protein [Comamonas testosteroni]